MDIATDAASCLSRSHSLLLSCWQDPDVFWDSILSQHDSQIDPD